jgi:hypothetical protein
VQGAGGGRGLHSLSFTKQCWVNTKEEGSVWRGTLLMNQWLGLRRENLHWLLVLGVELLAKAETKKIDKSMRIIMPHNGLSQKTIMHILHCPGAWKISRQLLNGMGCYQQPVRRAEALLHRQQHLWRNHLLPHLACNKHVICIVNSPGRLELAIKN